MGRAAPWGIAAAVAAVVAFAIWTGPSVPDPIARGSTAPDFALPRLSGEEVRLSSLRGRVVLVNFWATWCKPCEEEMPAMERLYRALEPEGLELLAVSVDDTRDVVEAFQAEQDLSFPILLDPDQRVSRLYQTFRYPETLLVDREGVVVERYVGPRDWDDPLYEARLRRLLAGDVESAGGAPGGGPAG